MTFGKGSASSLSKQKKFTRSSTKAEIFGADNRLPQFLWNLYFMVDQWFNTEGSILYQDNLRVMLLETNGRGSSTLRTTHIQVRYYMIKCRISVEYVTLRIYLLIVLWMTISPIHCRAVCFESSKRRSRGLHGTRSMRICADTELTSMSLPSHRSVSWETEFPWRQPYNIIFWRQKGD